MPKNALKTEKRGICGRNSPANMRARKLFTYHFNSIPCARFCVVAAVFRTTTTFEK
jgi:hypothetical protein